MRVTGELLIQTFINDIRRNIERLNTLQHQISTGKRIFRPSDDPVSIDRSLTVRQSYDMDTQYEKNVDDSHSVIERTDTSLGDLSTLLLRVRDLAVRGANEINPQDAYDAMAIEVNEMIMEAWAIANTKFQGRYLFGGNQTRSTAFTMVRDDDGFVARVVYQGDRGINEVWTGIGVSIPFNIAGGSTINVGLQMDGANAVFKLPAGSIPKDRIPPVTADDMIVFSSKALAAGAEGFVEAANPNVFRDTASSPFVADDVGGLLVIDGRGTYRITGVNGPDSITVDPVFGSSPLDADLADISYEIKAGVVAIDIKHDTVTLNRPPGDVASGDQLIMDVDPDPPIEPSIFGALAHDLDSEGGIITGSTELFQALIDLRENLTDYNVDGVFNSIQKVDDVRTNVLNFRTTLGVRFNRMTLAKNRIEATRVNLKELQSKIEDLDMAEAITRLKTSENVYTAALAVGARIIQPTLLDFLR